MNTPDISGSEMISPKTAAISGSDLTLAYERRIISRDLDVLIPRGEVTVIVGPNACGKSTILRALARLIRPRTGSIILDGKSIDALPAKEFARALGLLPQQSTAPSGITVGDLVGRGRYPHQNFLQQWRQEDEIAVDRALRATGMIEFADRPVEELSGGQRQRVWISLVIAQDPEILLLDEPTTYLDIANQLEVLELCRKLNREGGRTVVIVLHELSLAARYADNLIVVKDGGIVSSGPVREVLTENLLREVFRIRTSLIEDPVSGHLVVVPLESVPAGQRP